MQENGKPLDPPDLTLFYQNQGKYPREQLRPFAGQYIAWSLDGLRVLAHGETMEIVEEQLVAAGIPPSQVVGDFVPPPDLVLL